MGKFILHSGHIRTKLQTGNYRSRKEKAFSGFGLKDYIFQIQFIQPSIRYN
ncbi:hypothetical protein LJE86_11975 [bacterium BMS3Abin03]|nr:hypothetical protein [bacterium BMS3Abin03]MCG6960530.1 hypothetical protein [bacterium BMS3Abin03]